MSRIAVLGLAVFGLVFAGLAAVRADLLLLAIPLAVYLLAGLFFNPWQPKLKVFRQISAGRVVSGSLVEVTLNVTNEGEPLDRVWLVETLPTGLELVEGETERFSYLLARQSLELHYTVRALRGVYNLPAVTIRCSDRFNLAPRRLVFALEDTIAVLPNTLRLPHLPIRPQLTHGFNGMIPARRGGPGVLFYGLRDYQPGDELRWINWRASARLASQLITNEFQQESAANVGLILDARQESYLTAGEESLFEHAILAAASLAEAFINDGNRVGLVHYGQYVSWTLPGYGKVQRERILTALADASPGDSQIDRLEYLPARFVPPGSQLVYISPLLKRDVETLLQLRARRYAVLVICPNPVIFEAGHLPETKETRIAIRIARLERQLMLRPLAEAGIQILDWDVRIPFDQMIQVIARGAGRFLVSRS